MAVKGKNIHSFYIVQEDHWLSMKDYFKVLSEFSVRGMNMKKNSTPIPNLNTDYNGYNDIVQRYSYLQCLFVPFACVGSGDPVRVLRLLHNKYTGCS